MATPRERAEELLKKYTQMRALQIADTIVCVAIGTEDLEEQDYWEDVYESIKDIFIENTYNP